MADATTLMKDGYSAAAQRAQNYNTKVIEFARTKPLTLPKNLRA
jgi:hypothetical protein